MAVYKPSFADAESCKMLCKTLRPHYFESVQQEGMLVLCYQQQIIISIFYSGSRHCKYIYKYFIKMHVCDKFYPVRGLCVAALIKFCSIFLVGSRLNFLESVTISDVVLFAIFLLCL